MQLYWFIFAIGVASVRSETIDLNEAIEQNLARANEAIRRVGRSTRMTPPGVFHNATYSEGELLGLDSLTRTGNCWLETKNGTEAYHLHYGLRMWVQTFKSLKINDQEMSAVFRVRNNSINFDFTIHRVSKCYVTVDNLQVEYLADVEFASSIPEFDGKNVEQGFQYVTQAINDLISSHKDKITSSIQFFCKFPPQDHLSSVVSQALISF